MKRTPSPTTPREPAPGADSEAREDGARTDLAELIADLAAGYLSSKGRGLHVAQLAPAVFEKLLARLLATDERFVEGLAGVFEMAETREHRHAAITRAPEPIEEVPAAEPWSGYPVPGVNR